MNEAQIAVIVAASIVIMIILSKGARLWQQILLGSISVAALTYVILEFLGFQTHFFIVMILALMAVLLHEAVEAVAPRSRRRVVKEVLGYIEYKEENPWVFYGWMVVMQALALAAILYLKYVGFLPEPYATTLMISLGIVLVLTVITHYD